MLLNNYNHYYDLKVSFLNIPVSPIYINALVLYNGKLLPTFVNLSIGAYIFARAFDSFECASSEGSGETVRCGCVV